jgi:hypothetical protein
MHVNKLSLLWKISNAVAFGIGAGSFIAATTLNFVDWDMSELLSACFYIVGSTFFLFVALQEYIKYCKANLLLVVNLFCSVLGFALYLVGSVGYLPELKENRFLPIERFNPIGTWAFILGSMFIR